MLFKKYIVDINGRLKKNTSKPFTLIFSKQERNTGANVIFQ